MSLRQNVLHEGKSQAQLGLVFLLLVAVLTALGGTYWRIILEPRLYTDARTQAALMAQSQSWILADTLTDPDPTRLRTRLSEVMDEILVLSDPTTERPFVIGIRVELDSDVLSDQPSSIVRGTLDCDSCFVTDIPLYAKRSHELLGIAYFHSSSHLFELLRNDVEKKLYTAIAAIIFFLIMAWLALRRLVARLQDSDRTLTTIFDSTTSPMLVTGRALDHVGRVNQACRDTFPTLVEGTNGAQLEAVFADSHDFEVLRQGVKTGRDISGFECELINERGHPFWAYLSTSNIELPEGDALLLNLTNISPIKQAEQALRTSEERFATVVDSLDDLVYVADMHSYELLFMNRAMKDIFGDRVGKICWQVLQQGQTRPCDFCTNAKLLDKKGRPRGIYSWEFRNTVTDDWYACRDRAITWSDGRLVRMETATNITTLKQAQLTLEKAKEEAESASRAKSEFLATMSHEIRTPMNGILGMVKLLERTRLTAKQREYIDAVNTSGEQLLMLLNDILDLSRIEAGKMLLEQQRVEISQLLHDAVTSVEGRARDKGLTVEIRFDKSADMALIGDATRLRQILINLLGNAVKFTHQGGIRLIAATTPVDSTQVALDICVEDDGIGIPQAAQQHIFDEFTQLDSSTARRYGGSGLGLAICRRLIDAMGGIIDVQSEEGHGSRFHIHLTLPVDTRPAEPAIPTPIDTLSPQRILLAEDNEINLLVAKNLLEQDGHQITAARNGAEAVALVQQQPFDVILMDLHMPVVDGIEATRQIRAMSDPHLATLPIIALTANIMQDERDRCRDSGMNGFIVKPFAVEKLEAELATILATQQAEATVGND